MILSSSMKCLKTVEGKELEVNGESTSRVNVLHRYQVFPAFADNYLNYNFMT